MYMPEFEVSNAKNLMFEQIFSIVRIAHFHPAEQYDSG